MSVPDLAPDDDDESKNNHSSFHDKNNVCLILSQYSNKWKKLCFKESRVFPVKYSYHFTVLLNTFIKAHHETH